MRLLDKLFGPMIDRRIEAFESDLISRQCEEVETMYRTMRGWRHDYHNHIQTLLALGRRERFVFVRVDLFQGEFEGRRFRELIPVDFTVPVGVVQLDRLGGHPGGIQGRRLGFRAAAANEQEGSKDQDIRKFVHVFFQ